MADQGFRLLEETDIEEEKLEEAWREYTEDSDLLSEWEQGFFESNYERFEKYKGNFRITPRQEEILDRIIEKLLNPHQ